MNTNALTHKIRSVLFLLVAVFAINSTGWAATYYVSTTGNYTNPGTQAQPWNVQKAIDAAVAGDTIYIRGGSYTGIGNAWAPRNSGTQAQPITYTNYPGEQVVFRHSTYRDPNGRGSGQVQDWGNGIFMTYHKPGVSAPKVDWLRIIGTDVSPRNLTLSDGKTLSSTKGIVMQGTPFGETVQGVYAFSEQGYSISVWGSNHWEIAGIDFVEVGAAIRTWKDPSKADMEYSSDYWWVHDTRVFRFFRDGGMQFNGDFNTVEKNVIDKDTAVNATVYGCSGINYLGYHNIIRDNFVDLSINPTPCAGMGFEWDMADYNIVEKNLTITSHGSGFMIQGGDNNIIRNNVFIMLNGDPDGWRGGIEIGSYDNYTGWPCQEELAPPNDPTNRDYQYYWTPRNCHSYGNQIYNNTVYGFKTSFRFYPIMGENTIIRNNVFSGWTRGAICEDNNCQSLPGVTSDHNATQAPFGFVDSSKNNFHLLETSTLIGAGYNLGSLVPNDFDGKIRPQGSGFDIGAYEFVPLLPPSAPAKLRFIH